MELTSLKIGDVVMVKIIWRREGLFATSSWESTQRGIIKELNNNSAEVTVSVPGKYEWMSKFVSKDDIIDKVKHGRNNDCCRNCAIGFDDNCGFYSNKERREARDFIENIEK